MAENGQKKLHGNSVNISVSGIPEELLHEFSEKVMKPQYAGGISEAVKDLMREAVDKQKQNEIFQRFPWKKNEDSFNEARARLMPFQYH